MDRDVRATCGASLSPDATAFARIVDDGGYPRAVQRFLGGWRASSCRDVELPVLDRRSGGRLVDAWAGSALIRVGTRGYRELIMRTGFTEIALSPSDPGSTIDMGVILDDHHPRRGRLSRCGRASWIRPRRVRGQWRSVERCPVMEYQRLQRVTDT
ncbi:hypothetical protein MSAR_47680 [Mycolicibacterium sarraceniae]|uniref:Uncharacterized protein n=1 Tax=Mycolicibacterium sarraceniae TaxID=1534348 RepID=A0A7I7SX69_9MYCO|nr:hypothetical protein MSAR_47680 [Mycolicibacterium sarraceniae]